MYKHETQWEWIVPGRIIQERTTESWRGCVFHDAILHRANRDTDLDKLNSKADSEDHRSGVAMNLLMLSIPVVALGLLLLPFGGEAFRAGIIIIVTSVAVTWFVQSLRGALLKRHYLRYIGSLNAWAFGRRRHLSRLELQDLAREWADDQRIDVVEGPYSPGLNAQTYMASPVSEPTEREPLSRPRSAPSYGLPG